MYKNQKGFTLIELLVVIAIIGVLAVIAVPSIQSMMGAADLSAAKGEVHTLNIAAIAYMNEHNNAYPSSVSQLTPYIIGTVKGTYTISQQGVVTGTGGWSGLVWDNASQTWKK